MSFVLWYSIVAFQCLKVWRVIFKSLGLLSFTANFFLSWKKVFISVVHAAVKVVALPFITLGLGAFDASHDATKKVFKLKN